MVNFFSPLVLSLLFHLPFNKMSPPPPQHLSTCKDLCINLFLVLLFLVHICSCFDLNSLSFRASFFSVSLLPDLLSAVRPHSLLQIHNRSVWGRCLVPSLDVLPTRRRQLPGKPLLSCSSSLARLLPSSAAGIGDVQGL